MKGVLKEAGDKQEQEKKWIKEWAVRGSSDSLGMGIGRTVLKREGSSPLKIFFVFTPGIEIWILIIGCIMQTYLIDCFS